MATLFYDHLINWEKMTQSLDSLGVFGDERLELVEVIEESLHTEILIIILSQLPKEKHEAYIERFHAAPYDTDHFYFIDSHSQSNISELIREHSERFFDEMISDFLTSDENL